jgi:hypothetical protein
MNAYCTTLRYCNHLNFFTKDNSALQGASSRINECKKKKYVTNTEAISQMTKFSKTGRKIKDICSACM